MKGLGVLTKALRTALEVFSEWSKTLGKQGYPIFLLDVCNPFIKLHQFPDWNKYSLRNYIHVLNLNKREQHESAVDLCVSVMQNRLTRIIDQIYRRYIVQHTVDRQLQKVWLVAWKFEICVGKIWIIQLTNESHKIWNLYSLWSTHICSSKPHVNKPWRR